ncbi:MAG: nodulation protein NfeD [Mycobacteriaceae bacterium]|nr:nodulation protein NfeD [Mycobacteriaceae bacterium]
MRPFLALLGLMLYALAATAVQAQSAQSEVVVGKIDGIINPVMASYVDRVITDAERTQAQAVVFYMDTPGGLSDAMRDINLRIERSSVPVLVYVAPNGARAGSAGVYISYAAHLVGMAPATNIGSATPIAEDTNGGEAQMSPEMKAKVTNDAVAGIRALADQRQRNADWAEQAVREGANLTAADALQQHVVNYVAADLPDLLRQADGATVTVANNVPATLHTANASTRAADMSALESFLLTITNPTIAYILLSMGSLGLLLELYNPGSVFPGVIGGICLLLAFYALGTLPLNFAGLALIAFGILLFALEPFLTAHGILAAGGAVSFVFGSILLINIPDAPFLQVSPFAIVLVTTVLVAFFGLLIAAIVRGRRRRVVTGREGLIGTTGLVRRDIEPGRTGIVLVHGELWQAVAPEGRLSASEQVVVQSLDGLLLTVRRAAEAVPAPPRPAAPAVAKSNTARA